MGLHSIQALGNTLFRTQLERNPPSIVNSFSNYALIPLQKIIGKKTFQVSNKNLSAIPSPPSFFSDTFKVTFKVALSTGGFLIIKRTRLYPLMKKVLVGITVVTILGVVARVISLFQSRVTTIFNENSSVFSAIQEINSGETIKTGDQKMATITFAEALKTKLQKDIQFFETLSTKLSESEDAALSWLQEKKVEPSYSYPFFTGSSLQNKLSEFPTEANDVLSQLPNYWEIYYGCIAQCLTEKFNSYLEETDPVENRSLADFISQTSSMNSTESTQKT